MKKIVLSDEAEKWLRKADPYVASLIRDTLKGIARLDNPRSRGKALTGNLSGLWRYRVRDYRIICDITDEELLIGVVKIDKRSDVYR
ncbi:type II toxin-antitoxin system mRNA interferase toxin, RelE/StbE family [Mobiluncus mulieris]|uniref:type II toxin-antitoxin system mRNA interferase toxin, RelE/StbE family n=1 Tax=Mobiluncus mulieris TaxID=2052 RepID=UPI0014702F05|nr:type II toxin-antitoxin system RelE/ParE family toxin [Mobiluncus mulieris]NMW76136.1 type II toxin-antitoxin system RelE/ParE family toxin [Mobiluncus mulieris]